MACETIRKVFAFLGPQIIESEKGADLERGITQTGMFSGRLFRELVPWILIKALNIKQCR